MISTQVPAGPFATMDIVGLETVVAIHDHWFTVTLGATIGF